MQPVFKRVPTGAESLGTRGRSAQDHYESDRQTDSAGNVRFQSAQQTVSPNRGHTIRRNEADHAENNGEKGDEHNAGERRRCDWSQVDNRLVRLAPPHELGRWARPAEGMRVVNVADPDVPQDE